MNDRTHGTRAAIIAALILSSTSSIRAAQVDAFWLGGTGNWNNSLNWSGSLIPNNGVDTYNVFIDNGTAGVSAVTLNMAATIDNATIDADDSLTIANAQRLRVNGGTINNAGTLTLGSTGSSTYLHPRADPVTLMGGGTIAMSNVAANWIYQEAGGSLINVDNTIRGSGHLGWTSSPTSFDNQGTIIADQSVALEIAGGAGATVTNTGVLRADNGATLQFTSANVNNTDGVIEALDNSFVSISSTTIAGGTFQTTGTGAIETENTAAVVDGVSQTVNNTGLFRILNADALTGIGEINNTGTIEVNSTGSNTYFYTAGDGLTLSGGGQVHMSDDAANWIRRGGGIGSLVNVDNTIHGSGHLGWTSSPTNIDNQGTIIANQTTPLQIEGGAAAVVINTGIIRADNGATLQFASANVNNTDGVIEALDNSHVSISSTTISGGTLQTTGTGAIETENTAAVIDGVSQTLTNTGLIRILNADALTGIGEINNTGTIEINSTASNTYLYPNGDGLTLSGGGQVHMSNNANNWIRRGGGVGSLTNVDNTIHGSGNIGWTASPTTIDNQGTIIADQTASLTIQGGGAATCINTGTIRAENNATLAFASAAVTNTGGVIEALEGSSVTLASTAITGGTLQTAGSGAIKSADANSVIADLTNAGLCQVSNATRLYFNGAIHNTGTIELNSTGGATYLFPHLGPVTLTGGGTIALSDSPSNWLYQSNGGSLVNMDNTIRGSGHIGWTAAPTNVNNQALFVADQPTPMVIQGGTNATFTNTGTVRAENGGEVHFETATVENTGGVIEALDGSKVTLRSTVVTGGTLQTTGAGVIETADAGSVLSNLTTTGLCRIPNATRLYLDGTIHNTGSIELNSSGSSTYIFPANGPVTLTGGGTIAMSDENANWIYQSAGGSLVNVDNTIRGAGNLGWSAAPTDITNQGTIIADGTNQLLVDCGAGKTIDNQGAMIVDGAGGMRIQGNFTTSGDVTVNPTRTLTRIGAYPQTGGSTTVDGTLSASLGMDIQAGSLSGAGTVVATVTNAGAVSPGNSIGDMFVTGSFTQFAGGELFIEFDDMANDKLAITGAASLSGTLRLDFAHDPAVGTTYQIMTFAGRTGEFDDIDVPCLPNGKSVYVSYGQTSVVVTIGDSLLADANCDCALTTTDIELFTLALLDPDAYEAATPNCNGIDAVDVNDDGLVNGLDIQPFMSEFLP